MRTKREYINIQEGNTMTTYVDVIARKDTITIDGYTSNKTERGIIKDVARVVSKYDQSEANTLLDYLKLVQIAQSYP